MKKLLLSVFALITATSLAACGNENNSTGKTKNNIKTEQHKPDKKTSPKSDKKNDSESDKSNENNTNAETTNKNDDAKAATTDKSNDTSVTTNNSGSNATSTQESQTPRSQKDETNGMGNVVTSPSQAIATLQNGLGNNSDFAYTMLSTANHMYEIQVTSKSIKAQGGTGTVGIYDVMEDGTYFLRP
ncbi:LptM family lipoprotein [Fructilactobacillus sp. Tb1]|uniref:LptM family lipoprotein n=1 Tax=Fructilactobacillus sp. Tb1 TaxID=3422304 RepID=UPI003D2C622D